MMRRMPLVVLVAAAGVAGMVAVTAAAASRPQLRIVDRSPLVLRGLGFGALETVKLDVALGQKAVRRLVRADRAGAFSARFPGLVYDRCHGALHVTATGSRGHRAAFDVEPLDCPSLAGAF